MLMSWADDIRCLYCDGRLPLYRKITNGQFCSAAHRKAYWQEQERLALERLHQTHDSLRAFKPRGPVEAILGKTEETLENERPAWMTLANTGDVPMAPFVRDSAKVRARWLVDRIAIIGFELLPSTVAPRLAVARLRVREAAPASSGRIAIPCFSPAENATGILTPAIAATPFLIAAIRRVNHVAAPIADPVEIVIAPAPLVERLFAVAGPQFVAAISGFIRIEPSPLDVAFRATLPEYAEFSSTAPVAALAGLFLLPKHSAVADSASAGEGPRAIEMHAAAPLLALATPPIRPRLRLASGRRYRVETPQTVAAAGVSTHIFEAPAAAVRFPQREAKIIRAAAGVAQSNAVKPGAAFEPGPAGLLPLTCNATPSDTSSIRPAPAVMSGPQPPRPEPVRPVARFEPHQDFMAHPPAPAVLLDEPAESKRSNVLTHTIDFWNRAPRDLKMLAFAIPLLLGLALHPALPKVRVSAPTAASGFQKNVQNAVNTQWASFKQSVFDRAAIALDEDFRSGLDDWASRGDTATEWSFDATGFVRPGALALYRPSMNLSDYQLQFLGMIDKKALSWVVRAVDFDNYYVVKLVVLKGGPLPTIGLTRYAVVNGRADSRADTIVAVDARSDMLYRVRMDVRGEDYSLTVQGQMVDAWSEPRLTHGGIGFFTARGEESRLRWVQVTHQYDMLGRLCAYLAPYNIPSTSGNWQP